MASNDCMFFVRSGYTGTQQLVPAVWSSGLDVLTSPTQAGPSRRFVSIGPDKVVSVSEVGAAGATTAKDAVGIAEKASEGKAFEVQADDDAPCLYGV